MRPSCRSHGLGIVQPGPQHQHMIGFPQCHAFHTAQQFWRGKDEQTVLTARCVFACFSPFLDGLSGSLKCPQADKGACHRLLVFIGKRQHIQLEIVVGTHSPQLSWFKHNRHQRRHSLGFLRFVGCVIVLVAGCQHQHYCQHGHQPFRSFHVHIPYLYYCRLKRIWCGVVHLGGTRHFR